MKDECSDFDKLDEHTKYEIDRWNSQRVGLIQRRMHQELEVKLDQKDIEPIKPSKPFLRMLVTTDINNHDENCFTRNETNQAFVTIWDPSSEQLDLLDSGAFIRIKNLDTKGSRYEGLRQFCGGPSTPILPMSILPLHESRTPEQQNYSSIFSIHLQSKRFIKDVSKISLKSKNEASVVGVLLDARTHESTNDWTVYITDKSHLLLKVQCVNPSNKLCNVLRNSLATKSPLVVEFENTVIMEFDEIEQCAVVTYPREAGFCENPRRCYVGKLLHEWSTSDDGYTSILKLKSYLKVGVHELKFQAHQYAIGYIFGLCAIPSQAELFVKIDCGSPFIHTWRLPFALVQSLNSICHTEELRTEVALNEDQEVQLANLKKLGQIFGSRKRLFCFKLGMIPTALMKCQNCAMQVSNVSAVDTNALAAMYSIVMRNSTTK
jgi:hypothetical protein